MENQEKINFNVIAEGNELIIRHGKADEIFHHEGLDIQGTIETPAKFVELNGKNFKTDESICEINLKKGIINLLLNYRDRNPDRIQGRIIPHQLAPEVFQLNKQSKFSIKDLLMIVKRNKRFFRSSEDALSLIKSLERFKSEIVKTVEDSNDNKGNIEKGYRFALNNVSIDIQSFILSVPLFQGEESERYNIEVEMVFDVIDGDLVIYLVSNNYDEMIESESENKINSTIEKMSNFFGCVYYNV